MRLDGVRVRMSVLFSVVFFFQLLLLVLFPLERGERSWLMLQVRIVTLVLERQGGVASEVAFEISVDLHGQMSAACAGGGANNEMR